MKRRADAVPVVPARPPFDPRDRLHPSFLKPDGVLVAAMLYAHRHDLGPDRPTAARTLADEWLSRAA